MSDAVEYRDVPGFLGYRVGSDGSLWSCRLPGSPGKRDRLGPVFRKLKGSARKGDYIRDSLQRNGRQYQFLRHRLVLLAFVGPCPPGYECCHANDIRNDNRLSNISWGTTAQNWEDRERNGRIPRGERHRGAKLTTAKVAEVRKLYGEGKTVYELSRQFGVGLSQLAAVIRGERWADPQATPPTRKNFMRGESHRRAKLTWEKVREIRRLFATGQLTKVALGKRFGVTASCIANVVNGDVWKEGN